MIHPIELEYPIRTNEQTPIGKEFRKIMEDLGIKVYKNNVF